jgi:hypothetical protein
MCADCKDQHNSFNSIWKLYSLQLAGYPFGKDELTMAEWMAIAEMKSAIEEIRIGVV